MQPYFSHLDKVGYKIQRMRSYQVYPLDFSWEIPTVEYEIDLFYKFICSQHTECHNLISIYYCKKTWKRWILILKYLLPLSLNFELARNAANSEIDFKWINYQTWGHRCKPFCVKSVSFRCFRSFVCSAIFDERY